MLYDGMDGVKYMLINEKYVAPLALNLVQNQNSLLVKCQTDNATLCY